MADSAIIPLNRQRRSQQITEDLKTMIGNGELGAGKRIPTEAEMCRRYGVSRTTVREAVQALRSLGVLDVTPGRGSFVRRADPSPLFRELAVILIANGTTAEDAQALRLCLLRGLLTSLPHSNVVGRQELYQYIVSRQATAEDNLALQQNWFLGLARLAKHSLAAHLFQLVAHMTAAHQLQALANPGYLDQLASAQMRFTTTLCESDWAAAERLLPSLIIPVPLPTA